MKKAELNNQIQMPVLEETAIDLSKALILNGKTLEPQPVHQSNVVEKSFKSEKELTELVLLNNKILFGENTFILDAKKHSFPFYLLCDFSDFEFPVLYFLDISLSKSDFFGDVFQRITKILMFLNQWDSSNQLVDFICASIAEKKILKKELNSKADGRDVMEHLKSTVIKKSSVLLITDHEKIEIRQVMDTYYEWKSVKQLLIKKFSDNGNLLCAMTPDFTEIKNGKPARKDIAEKIAKSTEEDHLKNVSDMVMDIYLKIKSEILEADNSVEFNPKALYISIRKEKNLAFFKIGRNKLSLVVVHPEEETRKQIKHHEIKTLTEKVQKFWNGPSCTIVIENADKLNEVIALLKKMVKA